MCENLKNLLVDRKKVNHAIFLIDDLNQKIYGGIHEKSFSNQLRFNMHYKNILLSTLMTVISDRLWNHIPQIVNF